ncbi:MAG: hypothetical protein KDD26_04520, partial [Winogradskyella sp.]|nr:hypothetical protein [Winogradskyella sp.]
VGNTDPKSTLDISASSTTSPTNKDGILIPRIDNFPTINPTADQDGMMVFATGNGTPTKGFYYWNNGSAAWVSILGVKKIDDLVDGKSDSDGSNDGSSIFLGDGAGNSDDETDNGNVGIGKNALLSNSSGHSNIGIGFQSMLFNTTGTNNTALGRQALLNNTNGDFNVAIAPYALYDNLSGSRNIAIGHSSLFNNQGTNNVSVGVNSLFNNTSGSENISIGYNSLYSATTASSNTAVGSYALFNTTTGRYNTALGTSALYNNSTGQNNTAIGFWSGYNSTGNDNVYLGYRAGFSNADNNRLFIENTDSNTPLIYGEFDTNILRINGALQVNNPTTTGYSFPTIDGTAGQVMTTDGSGNISFQNINTGNDWSLSGNNTLSTNFLGTTNNLDLKFRSNNIEYLRLSTTGQLEIFNTSESIKIGESAGEGAIGSRNVFVGHEVARFQGATSLDNIGIGHEALRTITGSSNIAIGSSALRDTNSSNNIAIGDNSMWKNDTGAANTAIGYVTLGENDTGSNNTALGALAGRLNVSGNNNSFIGHQSGYFSTGNNNVFLGYQSGLNEIGSNKLYIESSNADANNALIYGEFDNDILRTNGQLQIGNPSTTGYALPTTDGTAGQVLTTDGTGNITFQNASSDVDFYELGTSTPPDNINDDKATLGTLTIGGNSAPTATLNVLDNDGSYTAGIRSYRTFSNNTSITRRGMTSFLESGASNNDYLVGYFSQLAGSMNTFSFNYTAMNEGSVNNFSVHYNGDYSNTSGTGNLFGTNVNFFSGVTNTGNKYGHRAFIDSSIPGFHFGIISDVQKANSFSGMFIGRVSIGNDPSTDRYILPTADGNAGQVMTTDGSGNVTFQDPTTDTDNQQIDNFSFNSSTNILTLEIEDDGQAAQTVDLSSLNPTKSVARIYMSVAQTETGGGITKVNFDTVDFDINSDFNNSTDEFEVPATGLYRVTAQITLASNTGTGVFGVRIRVNGTQERRSEYNHHGNGELVRQVTSILNLTAGQTIDVAFARPTTGATIDQNARASFFEIEQIQ